MTALDRSAGRPGSGIRGLPRFFWIALVTGAAFLVLMVAVAIPAIRHRDVVRDDGWTAAPPGDAWRVASVQPGSASAAALHTGDRILALDGDSRAARIGPNWRLADFHIGDSYTLTVERDGAPIEVRLEARQRPDPAGGVTWMLLLYAVVGYGIGMLVALAKPEDRGVRYAWATNLCVAAFMLWTALRPYNGVEPLGLLMLLGLAFPWYQIFQYLFLADFPRPAPATRAATILTWAVVGIGMLVWLRSGAVVAVRTLPADLRLALVDRVPAVFGGLARRDLTIDLLYFMATFPAMFFVLWRNYRALPEGGERRRVRVMAAGLSFAFLPAIIGGAVGAVFAVAGAGPALQQTISRWTRLANGLSIIAPLTFGYVIIKHRVLGFRVALRLVVQYALARNALRAALALPLAWLAFTVVTHPDRTISQILFAGSAKTNLFVIAAAGISLRYRTTIADAIDRRFFRAAYNQDAILERLVESIKAASSVSEIAALASREIQAALQVSTVLVYSHNRLASAFSISYSSVAEAPVLHVFDERSALLDEIARLGSARTVDELRARCAPDELRWLDEMAIDLFVPALDSDRRLNALLLVGARRSEEPFTSKDRRLLQAVATQIGSAYEVHGLRERIGRQHEIQSEVLASLDERRVNLVKECPACGRCYDRHVERCEDDGHELELTLPVDRTIDGKYRLDRLLGRGGMGAVYQAHDLRLNRRVAIKVIKGSSFQSASARRRFAREAQACARLSHPNIIRIYDYGAQDDQPAYLVMEYVEGRTWRSELERLGVFEPSAAADLLDQVLDGMQAAHAEGVLHRDLKPDNVLIQPALPGSVPQIKVLDFGLAKVREESFVDPKSRTVAGVAMGTFGYMSPEQLAGESVDERTDVFSLGVVAFETLTGPLPAFGPHFHAVIESEVERRLVRPAQLPEQHRLAAVVSHALAPNRLHRIESVRALRAELIPAIRQCREVPVPAGATRFVKGAEITRLATPED